MRREHRVRLLGASAVVVVVALATIVSAVPATAKGTASKPVKCATINGSVGGNWSLKGCQPVNIVGQGNNAEGGAQGASTDFPTSPGSYSAMITWTSVNREAPALVTTIDVTVIDRTGKKDKCGTGSAEVELSGIIGGNSPSSAPGVKGHVKLFVCEGFNGAVGGTLSVAKKLVF